MRLICSRPRHCICCLHCPLRRRSLPVYDCARAPSRRFHDGGFTKLSRRRGTSSRAATTTAITATTTTSSAKCTAQAPRSEDLPRVLMPTHYIQLFHQRTRHQIALFFALPPVHDGSDPAAAFCQSYRSRETEKHRSSRDEAELILSLILAPRFNRAS